MSIVDPANSLADTLAKLGNIAPERIRMSPALGTAVPDDVERIKAAEGRLYELVDGMLVEKATGFRESLVAIEIAFILMQFLEGKDLGVVVGSDGMMRLFEDTVRMTDVAFVGWDRFPNGKIPENPVPNLAPTIAVEVLSQSNTKAEMARKRDEYDRAGVMEVWEVDLTDRSITIYHGTELTAKLQASDTLTTEVLPGFEIRVAAAFKKLSR